MVEVLDVLISPDRRQDNGLFVVDLNRIAQHVGFQVMVRQIVNIPAGETAGNHWHPRREAFLCLDEAVEFHWLDKDSQPCSADMVDEHGGLHLFVTAPQVPHAIRNTGHQAVSLFELADGPQQSVEPKAVIIQP